MNVRPMDEWKEKVELVLESKRKEFEMLGYRDISPDSIWECVLKYDQGGPKRLYEVVQAIFQLQIHTYMDYLALHSIQSSSNQVDDELMASIHAVMEHEKKE